MNNEEEILVEDKGFTSGDWYKDLVEAHTTKLPEGAITVKQFMEDTGLGENTARRILKEKMGNEESFKGELRSIDGCRRWIFWHEEGEGE